MNTYKHSVSLEVEKCKGCTTCLRHCPTEEMLQLAAEHDMVVLATSKRMYEACGKLYQAGLYTLGESNE